MEIHATTTYDYEVVRDYMRYTMFRRPKTNRKNWSLFFALFWLLFAGVVSIVALKSILGSIIFLMIPVLMIVLLIYSYFGAPKRTYKKDLALQNTENVFIFKEDSFSLQTKI